MQVFKDTAGRTWEIKFSVKVRRRIRALCGIEVLKLLTQEVQTRLSGDEGCDLIEEMIWGCVEDQATERGVSYDQFWEELDAEIIEGIGEMLFAESVEAAPEKKRPQLRRIHETLLMSYEKTVNILTKHIDDIDPDSVSDKVASEIGRLLAPKSTHGKTS